MKKEHTTAQFKTSANRKFVELRSDIEKHPRLCGYYLIDLVEISGFPESGSERELFLDALFEHFDDEPWPPPSERPGEGSWDDHACDRDQATVHVVEALVGGSSIGHLKNTMAPAEALELWSRFEALFVEPRRYYTGMDLGDSLYAYQYGTVVIAPNRAGLLWIVDGD